MKANSKASSPISRRALTRRTLLRTAGALGAVAGFDTLLPAWARPGIDGLAARNELTGTNFDLEIADTPFLVDGKRGSAVTINGTVPGPILRWREGDQVTLNVTNRLNEDTSIHWHGILLPPTMDGVPGISFPGIKPGQTFRYQFPLKQAGTYWYHSHSNLQEPVGHYGPLVIDPKGIDPVSFDREYVVVLSDWSFVSPHRIFAKLKKMGDSFNFQQRTVGDFLRRASKQGLGEAAKDRRMWGQMRMAPTDIADVTGATFTYLVNGLGPEDNWTGLFEPGQRIRLRFINASAMSIFNVRIPGLPMTVVQADGLNVRPVETDEFQIGTAETYDVIVQPEEHRAFTLVSESIDRMGMGRATLAPELGMLAPVPALRERPLLTMKDMGMSHDAMGHGAMDSGVQDPSPDHSKMDHARASADKADSGAVDHAAMGHGSMDTKTTETKVDHTAMDHGAMKHEESVAPTPEVDHSTIDHGAMDHSKMDHGSKDSPRVEQEAADLDHSTMNHGAQSDGMSGDHSMDPTSTHEHPKGPGVANTAMDPSDRLGERGVGLEDVPHRVLVYTDLVALDENPDLRHPEREIELHLTSNMERYMWSFDGVKFSEVSGPIVFHQDERLRLTMVNDTMMPHPIHLHGMFFDVVNGQTNHKPRKHTIVVKPGEKLAVDITADAVGDWAFHCHLVYHMEAGMFRVVSVKPRPNGNGHEQHRMQQDHSDHGQHDGHGAVGAVGTVIR